jgi:hypothetical protein
LSDLEEHDECEKLSAIPEDKEEKGMIETEGEKIQKGAKLHLLRKVQRLLLSRVVVTVRSSTIQLLLVEQEIPTRLP